MTTRRTLMGAGFPALQAQLVGNDVLNAGTVTATTKATATVLPANVAFFTSVQASGKVILPPAALTAIVAIYNGSGQDLGVCAYGTAETINALSAAAAFTVTNGKGAVFVPGHQNWVAVLSA